MKASRTSLGAKIAAGIATVGMALSFFTPTQQAVADDSVTVYIDFEGFTLGQGFYIEPTEVTVPAGTNAGVATQAMFALPANSGFEASGLPSYLTKVKNFDTGVVNIPSFVEDNSYDGYPSNADNDGNDDAWLGVGDYSMFSGWMYTVNNSMASVGSDAYILHDGDVVRWQFTLLGYGCDLGLADGCFGSDDAYFTMADKSALIRALYAPGAVAAAKPAALDTIINPLATSGQVNQALAALQGTITSPSLTGLTLNGASIAGFDPAKHTYDLIVSGTDASVAATFDDSIYSLTREGAPVTSGSSASIALADGNNKVELLLTDRLNPASATTYTLNLVRPRTIALGAAAQVKFLPGGAPAVTSVPTINGSPELTLFRADDQGTATAILGYLAATKDYRSYLLSDASTVDFSTRVSVANGHARVVVDGAVVGAEQKATTTGTTLSFPGIALEHDTTVVTVEVCTDATYTDNGNVFVPENSFDFYIEKLSFTPDELNSARFATFTAAAGATWPYGVYSLANPTTTLMVEKSGADVTFLATVGDGVTVYKHATSSTPANTLAPELDGSYSLNVTGNSQAFATEKVVRGFTLRFPLTVNIYAPVAGAPDAVTDYIVWASQYSNSATYGLNGELTKYGTLKSLGNFGGHVTFYYEDAIKNDPTHPYGVDFMINGNSFGTSASEPGNVEVSADGENWYLLAGSAYFDDITNREYEVTYFRNPDGTSRYSDNQGHTDVTPGTMYKYPTPANYPLFDWRAGDADSYTVAGPLLLANGTDPYGSTAAQVPDWGYVDVLPNGTLGTPVSPYSKVTGSGSGFDLSWAVDSNGAPVVLDEIQYIKVSTASHIYAGAIGEKSTEVAGVRRAAETPAEVGVSAAPSSITINGAQVSLEHGVFTYYNVPFGHAGVDVEVTADASANVYINDARGATRTFATAPLSGTIRVVVQDGDSEPVIIYLNSGDEPVVTLAEPVLPTADEVLAAYNAAVAYENAQPSAANLGYGSEWVVLGLARGGVIAHDQRDAYLNSLATAVEDADGVLTSSAYTTYSRVALTLTALGVDATDFAGYDLTAPLADRTKVTNQGRNGVIFALLALNSGNYGNDADKEFYVNYLLTNQVAGGGWSLSGAADPDVTGMALQALAPYYLVASPDPAVVTAVEDALSKLSAVQADDAGFVSWGANASESAGQVINALSALGLGLDTPALVKASTTEARTVWDAFISFQLPNGAFKHIAAGPANGMATEQGVYNLNALYRALTDATSLYDMSDVTLAAWPTHPPTEAVSLWRFYNSTTGAHFYTGDNDERDHILASHRQFSLEGPAGQVVSGKTAKQPNESVVHRFFLPSMGVHFYSADPEEVAYVKATWPDLYAYEGESYVAYARTPDGLGCADAGTIPFYRFRNHNTGVHFYTADSGEKDDVVARYDYASGKGGFELEGIAYCILPN
ncbi:MAG: DUF4430 domain-containing protein [Propionibacteriaceae bacterium]|jgi:hypothetical protein|nr:DUF4430 domain-containing protein [Propionibacteriaceae bacterium]